MFLKPAGRWATAWDTFYRVKNAYEEGGLEALKEKSRRKPNYKNRAPDDVEEAVVAFAYENPALGQKRGKRRTTKKRRFHLSGRRKMHLASPRPGDLSEKAQSSGGEGPGNQHGPHRDSR